MNRQSMLRITLFISVLAFNPAVAQTLNQRTLSLLQTQEQKTLESDIADVLVQRGLEEAAAHRLSGKLTEKHSASMDMMVRNIVDSGMASYSDVVAYLGEAALFRREADLTSYDALVRMMTHIKKQKPSSKSLAKLKRVAFQNASVVA